MEKINYISIIFENLESIQIPIERIKKMDFGNVAVKRDTEEQVFFSDQTVLEISYENEKELCYDYNQEEEPLGMYTKNLISNNVAERPHILGRLLTYSDIVYIELYNEQSKRIKKVFVSWDENEDINSFQQNKVEDGLIKIAIQKPIDLE